MIKFSHTVFALPFAMLGYSIGVMDNGGIISLSTLILVILCMIFARSAAMANNRLVDRNIDLKNPRTLIREIPSGVISPNQARVFVLLNAMAFIVTTYFINSLCFYLSPVALLVVLGYSYTKRFTSLCHLVLGVGLGIAPVGAYMAVTGDFGFLSIILGFAVLFWVSGFDIIYALQDDDFDRSQSLNSIPSRFGRGDALLISRVLHIISASLIGWAVFNIVSQYGGASYLSIVGGGLFILLLIYQHTIVSKNDLSRVNISFFTTNGIASVVFCGLLISDFFL